MVLWLTLALFGAAIATMSSIVRAASVFAHFMVNFQCVTRIAALSLALILDLLQVQNSYSYAASEWQTDMSTAAGIGIDGFGRVFSFRQRGMWRLRLTSSQHRPGDYEVDRLVDSFNVAEELGFKLFFSFDMTYSWSSSDMVSIVQTHASSSAMFKWNNAVLVSTYAGDSLDDSFWSGFKSAPASDGITVSLAPAFTSYRDPSLADTLMSTYPSIDGFFNWWSWYIHHLLYHHVCSRFGKACRRRC